MALRSKHRNTLAAIFEQPTRSNIKWMEIESLFLALGARIIERRGSRIAVVFDVDGEPLIGHFHRPHPRKETDRGAVGSVREYLATIGKTPC
ncbi:MAG: type II toxin-antitoxin system HicA family toxin [Candidatus Kapaibacterium sp.]